MPVISTPLTSPGSLNASDRGLSAELKKDGGVMTKALLVAGTKKSEEVFSSVLSELGFHNICCLHTGKEAWRALQEQAFSIVLIISPLSDGQGYDLAKMAAGTTAGVILVCVAASYEAACSKLERDGVFVLSSEMGRRMLVYSVKLMSAVHRRLANAIPQAERMQEKLKDIRVIDKAKCLLIQYERLTEEEAHRRIEKQAMDRRVSRREVAESILASYSAS